MDQKKYNRSQDSTLKSMESLALTESTIGSTDEKSSYVSHDTYGSQDTFGESESNQVSIKGFLFGIQLHFYTLTNR